MLILVVALVQFTWMVLAVLVVKPTSLTALGALLSAASMATHRMLEFDVKVWINDKVMLYSVVTLIVEIIANPYYNKIIEQGIFCPSNCQWKLHLW